MTAKTKKPKQEPVDHGPPMAVKLGMSEDWAITAFDYDEDRFVHFLCKKKRTRYALFEIVEDGLVACTLENSDKDLVVKSVDDAVEFIDDALSGDEEDEE